MACCVRCSASTSHNALRRLASSSGTPQLIQRRHQARSASSAAQHVDIPSQEKKGKGKEPVSTGGGAFGGLMRSYGQPLPFSHPHLFPKRLSLSAGADVDPVGGVAVEDLTPGIPSSEYAERRQKLMDALPEGSVVVAMSGRVKPMSGKICYRFRQETNFHYLTGFLEADACVLIEKQSSSLKGYKMTMFVPGRGDEQDEMWNGPRTGTDGAEQFFGADEAYEMDAGRLLTYLRNVLPSYDHVYVEPPASPTNPRPSSRGATFGKSSQGNIIDYLSPPSGNPFDLFSRKAEFETIVKLLQDSRKCRPLHREVEKLRFRKSMNELRLMKRAGNISASAMTSTMGLDIVPGVTTEAHVQAHFEYKCAMATGLSIKPAYVPVVASGSKGLTIHYINNDGVIQDGDLICMDAGAEVDGYASDITRAWPANGKFSGPQRDIYEVLLRTLKGCTALATESQRHSLSDLHRRSVEMLRVEMRDLGGFSSLGAGVLERTLYPHYIGHWLGMDLHDTPTIERSTELEEGVVLTIEPGLYIPFDDRFPKHYQGIGIRLEDDVAVLKDGNVVLSADVPKEIVDVEAACHRFLDVRENTRLMSDKQRLQIDEEQHHAAQSAQQ
ncbi:hypothetical protein K437DRAFT_255161 [Tilletiaria anomala UBC 951]|uniref:Aminopeptidase P N-terminal domain-containing protein n=1 Tax=Tilletiaria anomala (strain ATCC 24038 / CBS 436.72 / UBC 951) TaxID=1037660 RepID=A0A066WFS2_TILAU|nr:uncharacterized protein K437DRAFT_255161 [Tilletiaria anomala UBC 951]KDN49909.1 hypothetical protein K437DRAFT_255161 [Tilletiaria anomala UBC 951]